MRLKVDESAPPREIGKRTPFPGDERRVITILARSHNARVFVEFKGDLGLERQACAFQDDFWSELVSHGLAVYPIVLPIPRCYTDIEVDRAKYLPVGLLRSGI